MKLRSVGAVALAVAVIGVAQGVTYNWKATGTGNWTDAGNWAEGKLPTTADNAANDTGGTMLIADGMNATVYNANLGTTSGKSGKILMTGGTFTIAGNESKVGAIAGGSGTFEMTGGTLTAAQLQVGGRGTGTMTLSGGKVISQAWCCIGRYPGSVGTMTVTGSGVWECGSGATTVFVAEEGTGTLIVENGGRWTVTPDCTSSLVLANAWNGTTKVGKGTVWLKTGGLIQTPSVSIFGTDSRFIFDGGTIEVNRTSSGDLFSSRGTVEVTAKGGTIDTGANDKGIAVTMNDAEGSSGGALVKKGTGTLTLKSGGTFSGGFDIQAGTLAADSFLNLPNYSTAPIAVAAGATLKLGSSWSDGQVNALTNRANFVMAPGATFARAPSAVGDDIVLNVASGTSILPGGQVFDKRVVKTGAGTLKLTGTSSFAAGVVVSNGYLEADYETCGLKETHLQIVGGSSGAPAFLRVIGSSFTAPYGTGVGQVEFSRYAGLVPGSGPLTVNFGGHGDIAKFGASGFNFIDLTLNDKADWPVHLMNPADFNNSGKTFKAISGSTLYCDNVFTNSQDKGGTLYFWGSGSGSIVLNNLTGKKPDVYNGTLNPREGLMSLSNETVKLFTGFTVGSTDNNSGVARLVLKDCTVTTSGSTYVNGATGTVMTIDGGACNCTGSYDFHVGYCASGLTAKNKTGTLVITNDAQLTIGRRLYMYSGNVFQHSGKVSLGSGESCLGFKGLSEVGAGPATYVMKGGELYGADGVNFQVGGKGKGLFWQTGGSVNVAGYSCVGRHENGYGEYRLHGGALNHRMNASGKDSLFFVSDTGKALLSIANGGSYETTCSTVCLGNNAASDATLMLSPGGTALVGGVSVQNGAVRTAFVFNGGTVKARTNDSLTKFFPDALQNLVVTPYGGTFDTNGQGDFSFAKPLTAATDSGDLHETIVRRWKFDGGSLVDSIGGKTATAKGTVEQTDRALRLTGGANGSSCVNLGTDLLPTDGRGCTIEVWFRMNKKTNWARLFNFGDHAKGGNELYFAPYANNGKVQVTCEGFSNSVSGNLQPTVGKDYYVAVVVEPLPEGNWLLRYHLHDAETGAEVDSDSRQSTSTDCIPANIRQSNGCWLGHSGYAADNDPSADYYEFRVHHRAMTAAQVAESAAEGADRIYAFRKAGPNKVTLTGTQTYACGTAVDAGTLALADGAKLPATEWMVAANATLQLNTMPQAAGALIGSGKVMGGSVTVTGDIQPGGVDTVGTLTLDGTTLSGGRLVIDASADGKTHDVLNVTGSLDLSQMTLVLGANADKLDRKGVYTLVTANAITGAFKSVALPKRWSVEVVGNRVVLSRNNGMMVFVR